MIALTASAYPFSVAYEEHRRLFLPLYHKDNALLEEIELLIETIYNEPADEHMLALIQTKRMPEYKGASSNLTLLDVRCYAAKKKEAD